MKVSYISGSLYVEREKGKWVPVSVIKSAKAPIPGSARELFPTSERVAPAIHYKTSQTGTLDGVIYVLLVPQGGPYTTVAGSQPHSSGSQTQFVEEARRLVRDEELLTQLLLQYHELQQAQS